jgi:hypothetical protein
VVRISDCKPAKIALMMTSILVADGVDEEEIAEEIAAIADADSVKGSWRIAMSLFLTYEYELSEIRLCLKCAGIELPEELPT